MTLQNRSGGVLVEFRPLSPEEVERTVQFLLQQQAQFSADLARFAADSEVRSAALDTKTERLADGLIGLTSIVGQLAAAQQNSEHTIQAKFSELGDYIKSVESHLDVVIQMFERHLRDDHGHLPS